MKKEEDYKPVLAGKGILTTFLDGAICYRENNEQPMK